jgi:hypothetical protein
MLESFSKKITKRKIQIALSLLWLLDGLAQLQPKMFTNQFANNVIAPAAQGQPAVVSDPVNFVVHLILHQPALFNAMFALIQLSLGVLILCKRTTKYGLIASIFWGLAVWYLGEGLGGLAGGQALLLTGAPGAALLYAIIGLAVMPAKTKNNDSSKEPPADWLTYVWLVLWLSGILLLLWSKMTTKTLAAMVYGLASGAPGWLAALDYHVSHWLNFKSNGLIAMAIIVYFAIGLMVILPRWWRLIAVSVGIVISMLYWVVGQSAAGYYSGLATDVSTAPLIILLGIAVLGTKETKLDIF